MCDPVTLGIALAMSAGGAAATSSSNLANAKSQAGAANATLAQNIKVQNGYQADNTATLDKDLSGYTPAAQGAQLADAQATRAGADTGAISAAGTSGSDPNGVQAPPSAITQDAPAAVTGEIAKRMAATNAFAKSNATALGNLGGYTDTWQQNSLNDADAARNIGYTDYLSNNEKSLLGPEQQLAETAAYKQPSIVGPLLTGAGTIMGSAAGSGKGIPGLNSLFNPTALGPAGAGSGDSFTGS